MRRARFAVRARGLTRSYRNGSHAFNALDAVSLDVRHGEFVAVMGPSGSGKSTFLNQVGLLDTPSAGSLEISGRPVEGLSENQRADLRARQVGFVFQAFNLISGLTAMQNVMLPMAFQGIPRRLRTKRARFLLERVGLGDRADHRPRQLSGGQKQRVAVARSLALEPAILLADEPTGNLDSASKGEIMRLFQAVHRRGRTILMVTHDEEQARYADRVVRFADGRVAADARRVAA